MTFAHPWVLAGTAALIVWLILVLPKAERRSNLLCKMLSFVAILVALSGPSLTVPQRKTAVTALVDTSGSINNEQLAKASSIAADISRARGGNWLRIIPFADGPRELQPQESVGGYHLQPASGVSSNATNFEAALSASLSSLPAHHVPRLVLISDGDENKGNSARALAQLQQLRVPVDTFLLSGNGTNALHLDSLSMPRAAYAGEQIPIDLTITAPGPTSAEVELIAEGKKLGTQTVSLQPGQNNVRVHARVNSTGAIVISGTVRSAGEQMPFEGAISLQRAKLLYISQDPPGSDANLLNAFKQADFDVSREVNGLASSLDAYQLVVLNNLDLNAVPESAKNQLERYVKDGGGLLLIGGDRQVYKEDKQSDALDRLLPAKLAPPKSPEGTCVALIIDKSSSMEGRKIELARLSAIGVVDHLRPIDYIGVLIFDNSFQWAVPVRHAEDKSLIKRLVAGITPDGGTQIAPALAEAYRRVVPSKATFKHIVLLTDGISEEGDSLDLAKEANTHQITISTVGLGQDVNRSYLEKVAVASGGKSYFLNDPQGLEQILLKDVQDYSGSTAVEKPLTPLVDHGAEILTGVGIESAPPLKGYARYTAKSTADTVLSIDAAKKDPLYVRWQYGLGSAAVFSSDAKSRWAENWVAWPGFDKFWINVTRDLLNHSEGTEARARFDSANQRIEVTYRLGADVPEPAALPAIFAIGPNGFEKPLTVEKTGRRLYTGILRTGPVHGLFRIRPVAESKAFPEVGLDREDTERRMTKPDPQLLQQISSFTGGRFNPSPESVFDAGGRTFYSNLQLWPLALALAVALTLAELVLRKWSGIRTLFARR